MEMKFSHLAFFEEEGFGQRSSLLKTCFEHTELVYLQLHTL